MAVLWTSNGKVTTSSRAVGTAPVNTGKNVFWDPADHGGKPEPDQGDVTANKWSEGTVVFKVTQSP